MLFTQLLYALNNCGKLHCFSACKTNKRVLLSVSSVLSPRLLQCQLSFKRHYVSLFDVFVLSFCVCVQRSYSTHKFWRRSVCKNFPPKVILKVVWGRSWTVNHPHMHLQASQKPFLLPYKHDPKGKPREVVYVYSVSDGSKLFPSR